MLSEDDLEQQSLQWFAELGWEVLHGPDIAPDGNNPLRASFHDVFCARCYWSSCKRLTHISRLPCWMR